MGGQAQLVDSKNPNIQLHGRSVGRITRQEEIIAYDCPLIHPVLPTPLHFASAEANEFDLLHNLYGSKTNSTFRNNIDLMNEVDAIEGPGKPQLCLLVV